MSSSSSTSASLMEGFCDLNHEMKTLNMHRLRTKIRKIKFASDAKTRMKAGKTENSLLKRKDFFTIHQYIQLRSLVLFVVHEAIMTSPVCATRVGKYLQHTIGWVNITPGVPRNPTLSCINRRFEVVRTEFCCLLNQVRIGNGSFNPCFVCDIPLKPAKIPENT